MEITTHMGINLMNLISSLKLRETIVNLLREGFKTRSKIDACYKELKQRADDNLDLEDGIIVSKLLKDNIDIANRIDDLNMTNIELGFNVVFDVMEAIEGNEKKFYRYACIIFGKTENELKKQPMVETIKFLINIFKSEEFMGLFSIVGI